MPFLPEKQFKNRKDAGEQLAGLLADYRGRNVVVYALPRGGVPLGHIVAEKLDAPLDLLIPRKIGHPINPEFAIAAVTEDNHVFYGSNAVTVDDDWLQKEVEAEKSEAKRRRQTYLAGREPLSAKGKVSIIVDDGIATGLTMRAAIAQLRDQKPDKIIVAIPVVPPDSATMLREYADELVAVRTPEQYLGAVGAYYQDFPQVTDDEVVGLLRQHSKSG